MTTKELYAECGLEENQLVNTNCGAMDIFGVEDGMVKYGFLAGGDIKRMSVDDFISKFKG